MTPTILWALLTATAVMAIAIAIAFAITTASRKARAAALAAKPVRPIDQECAGVGHTYLVHETGWRCAVCGNHVSRQEGELYGLAEDGRIDRRREPR
ncbi:MAG TPA: hypothetical protein VFF32_07370 [Dermatophilaceae bacterium]|nr:hypothetical protein [Dermatophilaceae bacterium]